MTNRAVPIGFEAAHEEWVSLGADNFRDPYRTQTLPDFYKSNYWKLVRQAVLASKDFKCSRCGGRATQVHHLNYNHIWEEHFYPDSLIPICYPCHGLVEYARKGEALISKIRRRISLCNGFLEDNRGCLDQNASHLYARLLEYQDELAKLRTLFANKTHYSNPRIKSQPELDAVMTKLGKIEQLYHQQANDLVSTWIGDEKEKAKQVLPLLEIEIENCQGFVSQVFAPITRRE